MTVAGYDPENIWIRAMSRIVHWILKFHLVRVDLMTSTIGVWQGWPSRWIDMVRDVLKTNPISSPIPCHIVIDL